MANYRAVLLLGPCLIILVVSPRAGPLDAALVAKASQRLIHEHAVVIGIETTQSEKKTLRNGIDSFDRQTLPVLPGLRIQSSRGEYRSRSALDKVPTFFRSATVFDHIALAVTRRGITPIGKVRTRHSA